jgi:hypothetical protein
MRRLSFVIRGSHGSLLGCASNSKNIYFNLTSFVVKTLVISVVISKDFPKTKNLKLRGNRERPQLVGEVSANFCG